MAIINIPVPEYMTHVWRTMPTIPLDVEIGGDAYFVGTEPPSDTGLLFIDVTDAQKPLIKYHNGSAWVLATINIVPSSQNNELGIIVGYSGGTVSVGFNINLLAATNTNLVPSQGAEMSVNETLGNLGNRKIKVSSLLTMEKPVFLAGAGTEVLTQDLGPTIFVTGDLGADRIIRFPANAESYDANTQKGKFYTIVLNSTFSAGELKLQDSDSTQFAVFNQKGIVYVFFNGANWIASIKYTGVSNVVATGAGANSLISGFNGGVVEVKEIEAGSNITVDATDPEKLVISSAGGGGGGGNLTVRRITNTDFGGDQVVFGGSFYTMDDDADFRVSITGSASSGTDPDDFNINFGASFVGTVGNMAVIAINFPSANVGQVFLRSFESGVSLNQTCAFVDAAASTTSASVALPDTLGKCIVTCIVSNELSGGFPVVYWNAIEVDNIIA